MTTEALEQPARDEAELVITRTLAAFRSTVFQAFADAEQLAAWWGPQNCRLEVRRLNFEPGGQFHYGMHMPKSPVLWGKFDYQEITSPERIVFLSSFADEHGQAIRAPFSASWPLHMRNELALAEEGISTILTLHIQPATPSAEEEQTFANSQEVLRQGFSGTFDRLEEYLKRMSA